MTRDFNAPLKPSRPADSSAATIAATGLLMLSAMEKSLQPPNTANAQMWSDAAIKVSGSLDPMCLLSELDSL